MPTPLPCKTVYHGPAPRMVTLSTWMCWLIVYVPGGIHSTVHCDEAAAAAALNALDDSVAPVGSAPYEVTDCEPFGWVSASATCTQSLLSIVRTCSPDTC